MFEKKDNQTTLNDPELSQSVRDDGEGSDHNGTEQTPLPPPAHEEFMKDFEELVNSISQNIFQGSFSRQVNEKFDELSAAIQQSIDSIKGSVEELIERAREIESSQGALTSKTQHVSKWLDAMNAQMAAKLKALESKLREELEQQQLATKNDITKEMGEVEGRTTKRLVVIQEKTSKELAKLEQQANSRLDATTESLKKLIEEVGRQGAAQAGFASKARQEFVSHKRLLWAIITVQALSLALAVYWFVLR